MSPRPLPASCPSCGARDAGPGLCERCHETAYGPPCEPGSPDDNIPWEEEEPPEPAWRKEGREALVGPDPEPPKPTSPPGQREWPLWDGLAVWAVSIYGDVMWYVAIPSPFGVPINCRIERTKARLLLAARRAR